MAPFRHIGPICQTREWYEVAEDGILTQAFPARPTGAPAQGGSQSGQPAAQPVPPATGECAFLNPSGTSTVRVPSQVFDRLRGNSAAAIVGEPKPIASFNWPYGQPSAAVERQVTVGGRQIPVILPAGAEPQGKHLPTVNQVAEALRAIPADQRAHMKRVILCPRDHPDTTADRFVAGETMSGESSLFPSTAPPTQNQVDNVVMHESGHNYHPQFWHGGGDVRDWKAAADSDNRLPSRYAGQRTDDDFCEFLILFNAARGTPCEATARSLYPSRWARMMGYINSQSSQPRP